MKKKRREKKKMKYKKQTEIEGLLLGDVQKKKPPTEKVGEGLREVTQEEKDPIDQGQVQYDIDPLEPVVPSSSAIGEGSVSIFGVELIPFMPTEGEEVPDFNTISYDK